MNFTLRNHFHRVPMGVVLFAAVMAVACGSARPEQSPDAVAEPASSGAASKAAGASVSGKGPMGTMVLLEPLFDHEFPPATGPAYMDQTGLDFVPAVLTAQTGQSVQFRNNEDVLHNVRVQETGSGVPVFNVATTPYNSYTYEFEKPGYFEVTCDIHTSMRATIVVTPTPYVGIADGAGKFAFDSVVPGEYAVTWFENGKLQRKEVEIRDPDTEITLP